MSGDQCVSLELCHYTRIALVSANQPHFGYRFISLRGKNTRVGGLLLLKVEFNFQIYTPSRDWFRLCAVSEGRAKLCQFY